MVVVYQYITKTVAGEIRRHLSSIEIGKNSTPTSIIKTHLNYGGTKEHNPRSHKPCHFCVSMVLLSLLFGSPTLLVYYEVTLALGSTIYRPGYIFNLFFFNFSPLIWNSIMPIICSPRHVVCLAFHSCHSFIISYCQLPFRRDSWPMTL